MRAVVCVMVTGAALWLLACGAEELPFAPGELTAGIAIYHHADYQGESALITEDVKDLKDFKGPCETSSGESADERWNDCISSVRVAPGWRAILFRDDGYEGDRLEVTGDIPNLALVPGDCSKGGFNDCITSIRVFRP